MNAVNAASRKRSQWASAPRIIRKKKPDYDPTVDP
ncbi:hypothetical protein PR003_g6632 [Phytophthora rubi]|uniref:Uncharacterized protein n=1 Tax=Phytophthora rubi TaxID=129364 RepID=A0A6A4G0B0_9STRA|nr:hypothetical protein PR002_g4101 [Phytophthora rubi]KAE9048423.1 hypothetical protein PR001_g3824 [Phytophthora rubi]KAE9348002.1 hypothetical protein PR003_g6632 [Phytophthora rubi]